MLNSWDKIDVESKKKFIKIIEEQSDRLINLVENILTVSKINTNKPIYSAVNVNKSIEKIIPLISQKYNEHKFITEFKQQIPPAKLDEDKFQQIITNILDNACKYSIEKKEVIIITNFMESDRVQINIKDFGIGIEQSQLDKIFDKFIRLENHLTSKTQGNGLGLYITKNLVESMGGSIQVSSQINEGTEFHLEFPLYNAEEVLKCSLQY